MAIPHQGSTIKSVDTDPRAQINYKILSSFPIKKTTKTDPDNDECVYV